MKLWLIVFIVREALIPVRGRRRSIGSRCGIPINRVREALIPVRGRRRPVRPRRCKPFERGQRSTNPRKGTETIDPAFLIAIYLLVREALIPVRGRRLGICLPKTHIFHKSEKH